jgi:uncharacterized protein (TIGR03083 family)
MTLSVQRCTDAIETHARALARQAPDALSAPIEKCPGWTVASVLEHLIEVHWFWATMVDEHLSEPPGDERRPSGVAPDELADQFLTGALRLVDVLRHADQESPIWTWTPLVKNVSFVTRHQVQEIAVHHWDVAHASESDLVIDSDLASDAVVEFLTLSVSSASDPADPPRPSLDGRLGLRCTDIEGEWTVYDGTTPGTVAFAPGVETAESTLEATSSDFLLWLYSRVDIPGDPAAIELGTRLHALSFTN